MPIVSCVIYNDPYVVDDLDSMLFHQMAGRAGRRGYTKKGNVIFAGYSWERIQELSISSIPNIVGIDSINYSGLHAQVISQIQKNKLYWESIYYNYLVPNNDYLTFEQLKSNYEYK
jgi:replicative superfamily II helicase